VALAAEHRLADKAKLDELISGARAWGRNPDALWTNIVFGAVGWVPELPA